MECCCSNCNDFYQPYNAEETKYKYRTALSGYWNPQSLCAILTGSHQPKDKWSQPLIFPGILKQATYLEKYSTKVYILNPKANCFSIKGLHHRHLYSKACNLSLNGIRKTLCTGTITKILFSVIQHLCNRFFFIVSNSFK